MPIRNTLSDLLDHSQTIIRVIQTGLFDVKDYRQTNRLGSLSQLRTIWHWVRHGYREGRVPHSHPLHSWLINKVTANELKPDIAGQIARIKDQKAIEKACQNANLNKHELRTQIAIFENDFETAKKHLSKTKGLFYLRTLHKSLRTLSLFDDIQTAFNTLENDAEISIENLSTLDLQRYYDLAFAAGISWRELVQISKTTKRPDELLYQHAIDHHQKLAYMNIDNENNFFDYSYLLTCALQNIKLENNFHIATRVKTGFEQSQKQKDTVILFLPAPNIWMAQNDVEYSIFNAFKNIVHYLCDQGISILALPSPFTRDLSHVDLPDFPIISYHTYAHNRPDIIHYKETSIKGYFGFDNEGYSGSSLIGRTEISDILQTQKTTSQSKIVTQIIDQYRQNKLSKYDQNNAIIDDLPQNFIFIPLQIADDSVRRWQEIPSLDLFKLLADYCLKSNLNLVVKRHPFDGQAATSHALDRYSHHPNIYISDAPIQLLLNKAKLVCTANSGVGLEALLLEKPVLSTGGSEYRSASFFCKTNDEVLKVLEKINHPDFASNCKQNIAFLNYYTDHYLFESQIEYNPSNHLSKTILSNFLKATIQTVP